MLIHDFASLANGRPCFLLKNCSMPRRTGLTAGTVCFAEPVVGTPKKRSKVAGQQTLLVGGGGTGSRGGTGSTRGRPGGARPGELRAALALGVGDGGLVQGGGARRRCRSVLSGQEPPNDAGNTTLGRDSKRGRVWDGSSFGLLGCLRVEGCNGMQRKEESRKKNPRKISKFRFSATSWVIG